MKKILITGGPVYGKIDDIKIVTNRFKGGLMAKLADEIREKFNRIYGEGADITYLTAKGGVEPEGKSINGITVVYHDGIFDYEKKVLEMAVEMDAVILGAAVANLIPKEPFPGKFPSHNYKPGDIINIPFTIAPRIIDQVKRVAPRTSLFGFKLLSGAPHDELINAAYDVVLNSHATAIFANDAKELDKKYAVTKEFSVIPLGVDDYADFIVQAINDEYYRTQLTWLSSPNKAALVKFNHYKERFAHEFTMLYGGKYLFGTIAVRTDDGFLTTARGKRELDDVVEVKTQNERGIIFVASRGEKATLNAPLLENIFADNPNAGVIVHFHRQADGLPTLPYAFPGTVRDSERKVKGSFNIKYHGAFLLFDARGNQI